jgi:hypothetical protein
MLTDMFAEHTGLLTHQLNQFEYVICDDDITYLNTHMGTYIFNSESLWNKTSRDAPAAGFSDYEWTDELRRAFDNLTFENETISILEQRSSRRSKSTAIWESFSSTSMRFETQKDLVDLT